MAETFSLSRLSDLRRRWERDPKSRVFLQLAEEYRRGGELENAVAVLRRGLAIHPDYISARVALGRCLFEKGEFPAAREALEQVIAQDRTQLVASKLLIETYAELGDVAAARERLQTYRLFDGRDAEIERLEARLRPPAGTAAKPGAATVGAALPRGTEPPAASATLSGGAVASSGEPPRVRAVPPPSRAEGDGDLEPIPVPSGAAPFGRLHPRTAARRLDTRLAAGGLFARASVVALTRV